MFRHMVLAAVALCAITHALPVMEDEWDANDVLLQRLYKESTPLTTMLQADPESGEAHATEQAAANSADAETAAGEEAAATTEEGEHTAAANAAGAEQEATTESNAAAAQQAADATGASDDAADASIAKA